MEVGLAVAAFFTPPADATLLADRGELAEPGGAEIRLLSALAFGYVSSEIVKWARVST